MEQILKMEQETQQNAFYMREHNIIASTIKEDNDSREANTTSLLNNLDYKGFVVVDVLRVVKFLKFLNSNKIESVQLSIYNNKLYMEGEENKNLFEYRFMCPLLTESKTDNINDSVLKLSVNLLMGEMRRYTIKDLKNMEYLFIAFGTDYPAYFKLSDEHKFIIAPRVDNN